LVLMPLELGRVGWAWDLRSLGDESCIGRIFCGEPGKRLERNEAEDVIDNPWLWMIIGVAKKRSSRPESVFKVQYHSPS
jgi:hypothetical protein